MIVKKMLLSRRFRNNGNACIPLTQDARRAVTELREEIVRGNLLLKSHSGCPLCGMTDALLIAEKDRFGIPARTVVCQGCGFVFNDAYFDKNSSKILYEKFWTRIQWQNDPIKNFQNRIKPSAFCWKRFAYICLNLQKEIHDIKTVFEIGCGDGCNLLPFRVAGKNTYGCDFDERCLDVGRKYGLDLVYGDASVLEKINQKADLVILSHVLEHLIDLKMELSRVKNLTQEGGYIYVEVPGILNWNRPREDAIAEDGYASSNNFLMYLLYGHNYHFNLKSLTNLMKRSGFQLVCGDEWVRAIFRLTPASDLLRNVGGIQTLDDRECVINHLKKVEASYAGIRNYPFRLARKFLNYRSNLAHKNYE